MEKFTMALMLLFIGILSDRAMAAADQQEMARRCLQMSHRFDSCIVSTFGQNLLRITPAEYLTRHFPMFLDTLSGKNLKDLVQPKNSAQQEMYIGTNVFRNCHDYNRFESCLDYKFGPCLSNNLSAVVLFNKLRGLVRRHGSEKYEQMRVPDKRILDVTSAMDYLCSKTMGYLDRFRGCFLGVFRHNKALGFDAIALSEATRDGARWTRRLCSQTQRFVNSLSFAVRRGCEADFKKAGSNTSQEILAAVKKMFVMSVEANDAFSPSKCRLNGSKRPVLRPKPKSSSSNGKQRRKQSASRNGNIKRIHSASLGKHANVKPKSVDAARPKHRHTFEFDYQYDTSDDYGTSKSPSSRSNGFSLVVLCLFSLLLIR